MAESKKILDNLYQIIKNIPQNPIAKLDEVDTILRIYTVKQKIENTNNEQLLKDYRWLFNELESHYQGLQRKLLTEPKLDDFYF